MKKFLVTAAFGVAVVMIGFGISAAADFSGDSRDDVSIFRPSTGLWAVRGVTRVYFGGSGDDPRPGDYNGDGIADIAIFRSSTGLWAVRGVTRVYFGGISDTPLQGGGGQRIYDYVVKPGDGNNLVAALESDTYSSVFVPAGSYNVSQMINVDNVTRITGENPSTSVIEFSGSEYYFRVGAANCLVEGIQVKNGGQDSMGQFVVAAERVTLRDCWAVNSLGNGFSFGPDGNYCNLNSCWVDAAAQSGFVAGGSLNIWATNCVAVGCGSRGFAAITNLSGCFVDGDGITQFGFWHCQNLSACRAMDCTVGFSACYNVSASQAKDCTTDGFSGCYNISGCSVDSVSTTTNGFNSCEQISSSKADNCTNYYPGTFNRCTDSTDPN